jgi:hypothetical protein
MTKKPVSVFFFVLIKESASGAIIKAPAYTNLLGFDTYEKMIRHIKPDQVIVIDNDMLFNMIQTTFGPSLNTI